MSHINSLHKRGLLIANNVQVANRSKCSHFRFASPHLDLPPPPKKKIKIKCTKIFRLGFAVRGLPLDISMTKCHNLIYKDTESMKALDWLSKR